jgi:hypothetical protein
METLVAILVGSMLLVITLCITIMVVFATAWMVREYCRAGRVCQQGELSILITKIDDLKRELEEMKQK